MNSLYSIESLNNLKRKVKISFIIFTIITIIFLALFILTVLLEERGTKIIFLITGTIISFLYFSYLFYFLSYVNKRNKKLLKNMKMSLDNEGSVHSGHVVNINPSYEYEFLTYNVDIQIGDEIHTYKLIKEIDVLGKDIKIKEVGKYIKEYELL